MAVAMTGKFPKHLDRDIDKIFMNTYMRYPKKYASVAKIINFPTGNKLTEAHVSGLGNHRQLGEGQGVDFDLPVEGREKTVFPIKFGLGFQITEEMVEDAVHPNIPKMAESLGISANHTIELFFWDLFNSGDSVHRSDDGKFIFATDHETLKSKDIISNKTDAALSETALQAHFEYYDTLVDEAGYPVYATLRNLLVPTKLRWLANTLLKQQGGITLATDSAPTGDNLLTTNPTNGYVDGWQASVVRYLDPAFGGDDENWFTASEMHDMRLIWKRKIRMESGDDFHTGNRLYKSTMRFQTAAFDYKGVVGSFVTS